MYFILEVGSKQVGETCGACFDPSNNFHCGDCVDGLECVADPNAELIPDLPSRCRETRVTLPDPVSMKSNYLL